MLRRAQRLFRAWSSGVRSLRTNPSYAIVSVLLLGTSSAALLLMSAIVDALLVRPPSAQELWFPHWPTSHGVVGMVSRPTYQELARRLPSFSALLAHDVGAAVGVHAGNRYENATCQSVSGNFFSTLGIAPARGRVFQAEDDHEGSEAVARSGGCAASMSAGR